MKEAVDLLIRADADPQIGAGHVLRCLALTQAARLKGMKVRFVGRIALPWVKERLGVEKIHFTEINSPLPKLENAEDLLASLNGFSAPWLVLDGYHFGPSCHKAARDSGYKLLVIDDYAHLPEYFCDILLNQNLGVEVYSYFGYIGQKLFGPNYVLLRQEFLAAKEQRQEKAQGAEPLEKAKNILLTLGGGNFCGHLERIVSSLSILEMEGCALRIIAGATPKDSILRILEGCPARMTVLERVDDMPKLLQWSELCITAGGSTCWELCCLGVPFLTVEVAKNQHQLIQNMAIDGVAPLLSPEALRAMLTSGGGRSLIKRANSTLVDGRGASRVLEIMFQ